MVEQQWRMFATSERRAGSRRRCAAVDDVDLASSIRSTNRCSRRYSAGKHTDSESDGVRSGAMRDVVERRNGEAHPKRSVKEEDGYPRESGVGPEWRHPPSRGSRRRKGKDRNEVSKAETREWGDVEDRSNDSVSNKYAARHRRRSDDAGRTVNLFAARRVRR